MSAVPIGFANSTSSSFLLSTGGLIQGVMAQRNNGVISETVLTSPFTIAPSPGNTGGVATVVQLLIVPRAPAPFTIVDVVIQIYDATNTVIYSRAF